MNVSSRASARDARKDEVPRLRVLEVDGTTFEAAGQEHPAGLLDEPCEACGISFPTNDAVSRERRLADPALPRPVDEIATPDDASPVVLESLRG